MAVLRKELGPFAIRLSQSPENARDGRIALGSNAGFLVSGEAYSAASRNCSRARERRSSDGRKASALLIMPERPAVTGRKALHQSAGLMDGADNPAHRQRPVCAHQRSMALWRRSESRPER